MFARDPFPIHTREVIASGVSRGENRPLLFDTVTLTKLRKLLVRRPGVARPLLNALGHPAPSVARHAFALALELGRPCGVALTALLPDMLAAVEREPPQRARDLREIDATLCAAIALVEQLAPDRIPQLYQAVAEHGKDDAIPWWTFHARHRLHEAFQRRHACLN